jgi:uncharacterized protein (DUF58 family)
MFTGGVSRMVWRIYTQRLTPVGRWFALLSAGFFSYAGASLQLQGFVPAVYAALIWVVAILAMALWIPRVRVRVVGPGGENRVVAGELMGMEVEVVNESAWRGGDLVLMPHRLARDVDAVPEEGVRLPSLRTGVPYRARLVMRCNRRGHFELKGFRVDSDFPFGLLRARKVCNERRRVVVYPRFSPIVRLELPAGRAYQPGGVALASELGESFEYRGNREYREGDNVRDIDWRATARVGMAALGGVPIVREWVEEYMLRVAVVLDTQVIEESGAGAKWKARWRAMWAKAMNVRPAEDDRFERAVSLAAAVADHMARNDYLVDLFAAGPDLYHLTAGRSLAYLEQILEILAAVEPTMVRGGGKGVGPFEVLEPALAELLDRLSMVVLVLTRWDRSRLEFAERLRERGLAVKVIVSTDEERGGGAKSAEPWVTFVSREMFEKGVDEL